MPIWPLTRFKNNGQEYASPSPVKPKITGAKGKRGIGHSQAWQSWSITEATNLFGPHNPHLIGDATLGLMEADPTLGLCLEIWATAYHGVHYWIEGPDAELNAFIESQWEKHHKAWIHTLLGALTWGRVTAEIVWDLEDVQYVFTTKRGHEKKRIRKNSYVIRKLRDYHPTTVQVMVDAVGDFAGIRLQDGVELSSDECIHVANDARFGDLRGRSLIRRSYSAWWWSNLIYLAANRYIERKGDPPYIGYAPSEEEQDEDGNTHDPIRTLAVLAQNLRGSGNSILPGEFDPEARQRMYELKEMRVAERAEEFLPLAQHYEALKAIGALTMPDQAGSSSAFASAKVSKRAQHNLFSSRQDSLILDPVNRWIIPKLVRANFPDVADSAMPRVFGGNLSDNALEIMAELVQSAQKTAAITSDGRVVPMGSLVDWKKALRSLSVPTIEDERIPKDLKVESERTNAGQPKAIQTNPKRPEGPDERGMSFARDSDDPAEKWLASQVVVLNEIDNIIFEAAAAVESERKATEEEIRSLFSKTISNLRTVTLEDGREVISTKNRTIPGKIGRQVSGIIEKMNSRLLDDKDTGEEAFAKRRPLSEAHVRVSETASRSLAQSGVPAPSRKRRRRVRKDIERDSETNTRGVATREARRIQEIVDRLIQGGASVDHAETVVDQYVLPARDLVHSTVSHLRGTARATFAWADAMTSKEVGGWMVGASQGVEARLLSDFPQGKVAGMLWRQFDDAAALDGWFETLVTGAAQHPQTSWRNLGRTFGSEEYYLPIPLSVFIPVSALLAKKLRDWNKKRKKKQQELDGEATEALSRMSDIEGAVEALEAALES